MTRIPQGTTANVVLDLSKYIYDAGAATPIGAALLDYINEARAPHPIVSIIVRASLLGASDRVSFTRDAKPEQVVVLKLDSLEARNDAVFDADRAQLKAGAPAQLLPRLSQKYSLGGVHLPIQVKPGAPDRFQVVFTIWDEQDNRPLDHLVFTVLTGSASASANDEVALIQGGFGAVAGALSSHGGSKPAASFYLFEYRDISNSIQTKAVYVALGNTAGNSAAPRVYTWTIEGSLATYLNGADIVRAIEAARNKDKGGQRYRELSRDLRDRVFPYDQYDSDMNAARALDDLANLGGTSRQPLVLMRYLSIENKHVYAPLAILNSLPNVKRRFQVSYPLPREDYGTNQCIGRVSFAYPNRITGQDSLEWDAAIMSKLPKDRYVRLENIDQLRCYLNYDGAGCEPERSLDQRKPAEVLVLLAHQANGFLWYLEEDNGGALNQISVDAERRIFQPGSAAFLNACSTLNSSGDGNRLVVRLNNYGVDAIVASPFPVDLDYGVLLSKNLNIVIAKAFLGRERLSVQEIFHRAVEQIRSSTLAEKYGEMDQEFLILGNGDIKICP